ncbi:MAG: putative Ig domain-containing protein [Chitinophagaceae bacterium]|nr:putative Ig domain-containing protein [Chitinophagaceae bacterium]
MLRSLFFSIVLLCTISAKAQPSTVGLIGYWPFSNNYINSGSAAATATGVSTSFTTNACAASNAAVQFQGNVNSYIDFVDNGNFDFTGSQNFTVGFSFFFNGSTTGGLVDNCLNYGGWGVWLWSTNGGVTYNLQFNYKNASVGSTAATAFTTGVWHHATAVRNNGTISLYIDGVFRLSTTEGTTAPSYPLNLQAGAMTFSGFSPPRYNPFGGKIDELRIYNRALSAVEIQTLSDGALCLACPTITVTNPAVTTGLQGLPFNQSFSASGGTGPYTYTTVSSLPSGITLSTAGVLSGTPTVTGTFPIVVTATDAGLCTGTSATYNLVISSCPTITLNPASQTNVSCFGGSNGAASVNAATGGTAPYSYNWTPGNPVGDGTTSVTGLTAGTWTCTVTDANGCTAVQTFTITQPAAALAVTPLSQTNIACFGGATGAASINTPTGGTPGYSYNWTPGNPTGDGTTSVTGLTVGTWTCTVTDANGCTAVQTFTITQPAAALAVTPLSQTNIACFGGATGAASVNAATGGTPVYTYNWTPGNPVGDGTASVTGLTAGTWTCTVTDANGCTAVQTFTITQPAAALAVTPLSQTNIACFGGATGAASDGTASVTGLTAGTWTCTVTDANGCTAVRTFTITQPAAALAVPPLSQTNIACFGGATGAASINTPTGGTPGYSYNWTPGNPTGDGTTSVTGLTVGTWTCTVTDANGCTAVQTFTITQPAAALAVTPLSQTNISCFGGSNGAASVNAATGGTPGYTYNWTPGNPVGDGTTSVTGLTAGTWTCTVTDANGCTAVQTFTITQPAAALAVTPLSQTNVSCFGGSNGAASVNAATGGTPGYTYNWTPGNPVGDGTTSVTGLTAGTWTCTVTDANGCTAVQTFTITQPAAALAVTPLSQTNIACFGGATGAASINTPTGGTPGYSYNWTPGNPTGDGTTSVTGLTVGTWTCTVTDANGCTAVRTFTITQPAAALAVTPLSQTNIACFGGATGAASVNAATGGTPVYTYNWTPGNPVGDGTTSVTGLTAGTWTCTVTDANGCTASTSFTITSGPPVTASATPSSQTVCSAASITTIVLTSNVGGTIYSWTRDNTVTVTGIAANGTGDINGTLTNLTGAPVIVTFTITPASGTCVGAPITATVTVNPLSTVNQPSNQLLCDGLLTSAVLFTSPTVGGTIVYNWVNNTTSIGLAANGTGNISPFTATNATPSPVTAIITVTPTYSNGGISCVGTPSIFTITVNPAPNATISYAGNPYCQNAGTATVTQTGTAGGTYSAVPGGLSISPTTGTVTLGTSVPGTYTVTYTIAAAGGCPAVSTSTTITITALPSATIVYSGSPYCSNAGTANVTQTGTAGGTYSALPGGLVINSATGAVTLGTSAPGTYTVTYSFVAAGGCPAVSTSTTITITALPSATIVYTGSPYCATVVSAPVTRTGTAGGTYSAAPAGLTIDPATGTVSPQTSTPGTYTVTYTIASGGGCPAVSTTTTITITAAPNIIIFYAGNPYCSNAGTANVTRFGTPGGTYSSTAGLSITPATGAVNLGGSTPGTYIVTYTVPASGGCGITITTTTITITAAPTATIAYTGSPYCSNAGTASVTLTGTPGGGTYSSTAGLTINPTTGAITLGSSTPGTYTVTYTVLAAGGCPTYTTTTTITITALPAATIAYTGSPYCSNAGTANVTRTGTAGGTYSAAPAGLTISATTGAVTLGTSTAGTYTVTYTIGAGGGCPVVTATTSITITTLPTATITYAGNPFCQNAVPNTVNVTRTGNAGGTYSAAPAGLSISPTTGTVTLGTSTPGTYTVTYTLAAGGGCPVVTATTSITVQSLSTAATAATATPSSLCGPGSVTLAVTGGSLGSGASWKWYSGSCGGTLVGTGATITIPVSATTTYFVRAEGTCNTTTCVSVSVTVNVQPTVSLSASPGTVLSRPGQTTTLTAAVSPATGTTITWYRNDVVVPGATSTTLVVDIDKLGVYTVRVTTGAGCTALSNAVAITTESSNQLFISPNPNNGAFKVRFFSNYQNYGALRHLVIFSALGQKVYDKTFPITAPYSAMDVDIRNLGKGTYFVMVTDATGEFVLATGKVITQ